MKLRTLLLSSILTLGITITSSSQVVMDTIKREKIVEIGYNSITRIDNQLWMRYRNTEYKTINDMRSFKIGDLTNYNSLKEAILDGFNQPKYESKRFTINDRYWLVQKINKREVWIFIYDGNIKTSMGVWTIKYLNKMFPKLD
jgi:hypothetical protein